MTWLASGILCLLAGCVHHDPQPFVPQQPPPPPKPPAAASPPRESKSKLDATVLDAKPINCVRIGDFNAGLAADPERAPGEREHFAQLAKSAYTRALQIDPKFAPAYMGLGLLYEVMGQREEALDSYRNLLRFEPQNQAAILAFARMQEKMDNRAGALKTLQWAITAMPKEPAYWYEQGMCLGRAKDFDAALSSLVNAAHLRPNYEDYNKAVGFMLARMGRPNEALPWLKAAKLSSADAHYEIARMMQHIGREDLCREQLARAQEADPNHLATAEMLAEIESPATPPKAAEPIRTVAYWPDESVQPAATLPSRPTDSSVELGRVMPMIPVVTDVWDARPASTPSLTDPAPTTPKAEPRKLPTLGVGFEANP
jgi:tetratricopeptide (TPR) repeat protein